METKAKNQWATITSSRVKQIVTLVALQLSLATQAINTSGYDKNIVCCYAEYNNARIFKSGLALVSTAKQKLPGFIL